MAWLSCSRCKERFALNDETEATLRKSSATFHCPWGHQQHFPLGPTETDLLRKERDTLKQQAARLEDERRRQRERAEAAERSAAAYRGVATRTRNRVSKGICPCCNRTFANLANHMKGQHPGYNDAATLAAEVEQHT